MYYDPIVITLSLSHAFVEQLVAETEKAMLVQDVHTILPSTLLQLASLVTSKAMGDGWITANTDPQGCRS